MLAAVSRAPEVATRTAGRFAGFGAADGLLIATVVLWGLHFPMVKYAITHGFAALVYATMRFGVGSAMALHEPDDDVSTLTTQRMRVVEHGEGLADTRRGADVDAKPCTHGPS